MSARRFGPADAIAEALGAGEMLTALALLALLVLWRPAARLLIARSAGRGR